MNSYRSLLTTPMTRFLRTSNKFAWGWGDHVIVGFEANLRLHHNNVDSRGKAIFIGYRHNFALFTCVVSNRGFCWKCEYWQLMQLRQTLRRNKPHPSYSATVNLHVALILQLLDIYNFCNKPQILSLQRLYRSLPSRTASSWPQTQSSSLYPSLALLIPASTSAFLPKQSPLCFSSQPRHKMSYPHLYP
jgi:hypothetical protein